MSTLLADARRQSGLTLVELADRAGTSHSTLSAYEHGRKQPQLSTLERVLEQTGFELNISPMPQYAWHRVGRARPFAVPDVLPRLPLRDALAIIDLPRTVQWSTPSRAYDLGIRAERGLAYETILSQGGPEHIDMFVDGLLLMDLWGDMYLPAAIRRAWQPTIERSLGRSNYHEE